MRRGPLQLDRRLAEKVPAGGQRHGDADDAAMGDANRWLVAHRHVVEEGLEADADIARTLAARRLKVPASPLHLCHFLSQVFAEVGQALALPIAPMGFLQAVVGGDGAAG